MAVEWEFVISANVLRKGAW